MVILTDRSPCVISQRRCRRRTKTNAAAAHSDTTKLADTINCQMPESGDVSILSPTPIHHNGNSKLSSAWNSRRHLKLNLNIAQCHHHTGGVAFNAANLGGRLGVPTSAACVRPSKLFVPTEDAHMTSKKSKLDFCPLPISTPASSLPGSPKHPHLSVVGHQHGRSCGSPSPSSVHPSEIVHYRHQTTTTTTYSSSSFYSCSTGHCPTTNGSQTSSGQATSPTTAFINGSRVSPLSSPVVNNCGCGIVCGAISSCSPAPPAPSSSSSSSSPRAKLKPMSPEELALAVNRSKPILIIDVRAAHSYLRNHVQGAVNLCCIDHFNRRRIEMGKSSVLDLLGMRDNNLAISSSPSTKRKSCANPMDIVVYDDHTSVQDLAELSRSQESALCTVLTSLLRDGNDVRVLDGGFKSFVLKTRLCVAAAFSSLRRSTSLFCTASPTAFTSPEIEVASVTSLTIPLPRQRARCQGLGPPEEPEHQLRSEMSHPNVPQYYDEQGIKYKRIPARQRSTESQTILRGGY
ncbi:Dual specificity protein phosphatase 10 [Bulinus truncatus]|nr:Dual specificity protein phosphatase 10 [Bulinus truncatus]